MAGMTIVLVLRLAGGLVRRRLRAVWRFSVVQCGEMAFFVLQPIRGRGQAGACRENVGDKNGQQQAHDPKPEAQQAMK